MGPLSQTPRTLYSSILDKSRSADLRVRAGARLILSGGDKEGQQCRMGAKLTYALDSKQYRSEVSSEGHRLKKPMGGGITEIVSAVFWKQTGAAQSI